MENTWLSYRLLLATQGSIYGENSCRYTILVHLAYKQVYPDHQWKFRTEPSISKALAHNSLSTWTVSCIFLGNKSKYLSCGLTLDWLPAHIMGQCYDGIIGTTARLIRVQLRDWSHILADFHPLSVSGTFKKNIPEDQLQLQPFDQVTLKRRQYS